MNDDLSAKYGEFYVKGLRLRNEAGEPLELHLTTEKVPKELLFLLPYAKFWGISDDTYRAELVRLAPPVIWYEFREAVTKHKMALLDWLSGPEADGPPTPEYLAFSYLLQAFDWPRD